MKSLTTTNLPSITNDIPQIDNPRFDVSLFPQSDNLINALNTMFQNKHVKTKRYEELRRY